MWTSNRENELYSSVGNECAYDTAQQIHNWELRRNFSIWDGETHSISLVIIHYIIQRCVAWSNSRIFQPTRNRAMYEYVPLYHVQFRSQCIKQPTNQISNTQRSITTVNYNLMRWTSFCTKLSPISIQLYVTAVYMNSVESIKKH
jgi:hypothetical protein